MNSRRKTLDAKPRCDRWTKVRKGKGVKIFCRQLTICSRTSRLMARPLRIRYPGAVYHVTNRGGSRQSDFLEKQHYEAFLKTSGEVRDRWAVEVFAYCIMGNHYHVCLRMPEGNLPRLKALCGEISSALARINYLGELARRLALRQ